MKHLSFVVALLCACATRSGPPVPPVDPHVAAAEVVDGIVAAADPQAAAPLDAWRDAHARFEAHLEGPLRARYGEREVARLEYGFGRVRSKLGSADAPEAARSLGEKVAALCADLPGHEPAGA